ncbi:bifunctional PIG-L family deacetylase/class I SAM-dependent methyltransferase [Pseudonocardia abyssalis]|uniref:Bifunctional PIG-L family deacetylase/class I SAM-dependent methyltransferase n=1 Tax=Pseudonocardia abyssalis TaxID=2792008 RepID=A0ABS6UUW0_9PSEU|nr:bifunctional PIG-L family deacetylase/class I SAM-dependent methyltransferase [Pseudonocardia abyssalis]MBW0119410.1 bifunctional PIG-L family deacetylase/class I SAM-dependent methyltransferase [Pseudonocardia abyssalis]MBW0136045.1 bifunctional PIG-L family deacetylase/class I SAM-dependent methyltransferase [Pseudonocardia abyssalis]
MTGPWLRDPPPRPLDLGILGHRVVVVAAHPDDETLGAGGLMRAVHESGGQVELVVATDGEAAFPDLDGPARDALAATRRRETDDALAALGLSGVPVHRLGMPDSALDADTLATALEPLLRDADAWVAPWAGDPHPDHTAAGLAAAAASPVTATGWTYPIWMWAWLEPDDPSIPWSHAHAHPLDETARTAKRRALACYASQTGGPAPIVPPDVLAHFDTGTEVVFRTPPGGSAPRERFDTLYAGDDGDPWATRTSWYERRKRAVLLASLPRERYRHAAEPACGTGALTVELAERCDRLDASGFSPAAVAATRGSVDGVPVIRAALPHPDALPDGIDLAVVSEVLYYLDDATLAATVDRLADAVLPGGDIVIAHWRGWPAEAPRDAEATHRELLDDPRFVPLVTHVDEDFLLHVLRRA